MTRSLEIRLSAAFGMLAVCLGAFGAHGLQKLPDVTVQGIEGWKTGAQYQLLHAIVMYFLAVAGGSRRAWWLFALGTLLFSGSLYLLGALRWTWLGPVTPAGGVLLIAGWATLMLQRRHE